MVKGEKKHTYTIDEKGGYKNPQPPILDLQCPTRGSCTNLEEEEGGEGGEDEGRRLRGGGKRGFNNTIVGWCRHTIKSRSEFALMREKMCEFKVRILENTELKCLGKMNKVREDCKEELEMELKEEERCKQLERPSSRQDSNVRM